MRRKVLIIIPAYNEAGNIVNVVSQITRSCPKCDYVVINDGSTDGTADVCNREKFNMIDLPVNIGLAGAVQAGMKYAFLMGYDYAMQFDGDGQHDTGYISTLIDHVSDKGTMLDVVIGSRYLSKKKPFTPRMIGSRVIGICIKLTSGKTIKDPTSGMRLYSKRVIERFATEMNFEPEPDTIAFLVRCGYRVGEVQVTMNERVSGESYLDFAGSIKYMMRMCASILVAQWFRWKG